MTQRSSKKSLCFWLLGGLLTAALYCFISFYGDFFFGTNDDQFILRTFMGYEPGGAPTFHLYIHGMYAYPLRWLSLAFPGVAWFSLLELGLLFLAQTTILKSILQCFDRAKSPLWLGLLFAFLYMLLFGMGYIARVTYTTTAAMLGAAAVAQILSVDCGHATDKSILRSMGYGLLLVVLCYGLRQMTALPVLAYCGIAFLLQFFRCFGFGTAAKRNAKPLWMTLILVVLVMGGLAVGREVEITYKGQREYLEWQQARISVLDYMDLEKVSEDTMEALGWTEAQQELLLQWNTMDEMFTTEAFRTIRETEYNSQTRTSPGVALQDLLYRSHLVVRSILILAAFALCALVLLWRRRKAAPWDLPALLLALGFCVIFLIYLALQGRLPYRAVMVPVLPAAVFVFCLLGSCIPPLQKGTTPGPVGLGCLLCIFTLCSCWYAVPYIQSIRHQESQWDYDAYVDMDQQAVAHPDLLLIYDTELVNDPNMFPDTSEGIPTNLMFWGGWQRSSPEYLARLASFGIDGNHFIPDDWLRPEVRFISLKDTPNQALLNYLQEQVSSDVTYIQEKVSAGLYFYRFVLEVQ